MGSSSIVHRPSSIVQSSLIINCKQYETFDIEETSWAFLTSVFAD